MIYNSVEAAEQQFKHHIDIHIAQYGSHGHKFSNQFTWVAEISDRLTVPRHYPFPKLKFKDFEFDASAERVHMKAICFLILQAQKQAAIWLGNYDKDDLIINIYFNSHNVIHTFNTKGYTKWIKHQLTGVMRRPNHKAIANQDYWMPLFLLGDNVNIQFARIDTESALHKELYTEAKQYFSEIFTTRNFEPFQFRKANLKRRSTFEKMKDKKITDFVKKQNQDFHENRYNLLRELKLIK